MLRWRDRDAVSLPDRLFALRTLALPLDQQLYAAGVAIRGNSPYPAIYQTPNLITHASFDVSAPSMLFTSPDLADNLAGHHAGIALANSANFAPPPLVNSHITQLLAARIDVESQTDPAPNNYPPVFGGGTSAPLGRYFDNANACAELIAGERMNLNRPLGNGFDDNNNGITDEPGEADYGLVGNGHWRVAKQSVVSKLKHEQRIIRPCQYRDHDSSGRRWHDIRFAQRHRARQ